MRAMHAPAPLKGRPRALVTAAIGAALFGVLVPMSMLLAPDTTDLSVPATACTLLGGAIALVLGFESRRANGHRFDAFLAATAIVVGSVEMIVGLLALLAAWAL